MEKVMKKLGMLAIACVLVASSVLFGMGLMRVKAAGENKLIKMSIDTSNEKIKSHVGQMTDDKYFTVLVAPFGIDTTVDATFQEPYKNNKFADWWNGVGDNKTGKKFAIEYEVFSNSAVSVGMVPYFSKSWQFGSDTKYGFKDGDGLPLLSTELSKKLGNGWYKRTLDFDTDTVMAGDILLKADLLQDLYFTLMIKKEDIALDSSVDVYIRNFYVTINGTKLKMYGDAASHMGDSRLSVNYFTGNHWSCVTGGGIAAPYCYVDVDGAAAEGMSVTGVNEFEVVKLLATENNILKKQGEEIDLLSFVSASIPGTAVTVANLTAPDGADMTAEVSGGKITAEQTGTYSVTYSGAGASNTAKLTITFQVEVDKKPVILQEDVNAAVVAKAYANQKYTLPLVLATLQGTKDVICVPTVTGIDGEDITVSDEGSGIYSFVPTAKKEGNYTVTYTATNEEYSDSKSATLAVTDLDKPVISFDNLPTAFEVGATFTVPELVVTDISDEFITDYVLEIRDPHGNKITPKADKFLVELSGKYIFKVTATDSDGNVITKSAEVNTSQSAGLVYKVTLNVPEAKRAEGQRKFFAASLYELNPKLTIDSGDKLVYEVMSNSAIAGIGSFSGQMQGTVQGLEWPRFSQLYKKDGKAEIKDTAGDSMMPTTDISAKLSEDGKAVWYKREVEFKAGDTFCGGTVYHWGVEIDTTAACGETIEVSYKNAYILKADGTKIMIIDGTHKLDATHWGTVSGDPDGGSVNVGITSGFVNASLDKFPIVVSDLIPKTAGYNEEMELPLYLMLDQYTGMGVETEIEILDPAGVKVTVTKTATGYKFKPDKLGNYVIHITGSNSYGMTKETVIMSVSDNELPTITVGEYEKRVLKGGKFTLPEITFADNATASGDLVTSVSVFFGGQKVDQNEDKTYTFAQTGTYQVVISAKDAVGNESITRLEIECYEEQGGGANAGGCGSVAFMGGNGTGGGLAILFGMAAVLAMVLGGVLLRKRHSN